MSAGPTTPRPRAVRLHRTIYSAKAVSAAALAFADLADIEVRKSGDYHEVTLITDGDIQPDALRGEFTNYALCHAARNR